MEYNKQTGGYDPDKHGRLEYGLIHSQLEKIRREKTQNIYISKNVSGYLKYKNSILRNINNRDHLLYAFVREYSVRMADDELPQDYEGCLIECMAHFDDRHETVLEFQTSCKFDSGLKEFEDRDIDEAYKIFIHAIYRLTLYNRRYKNFNLPSESSLVNEVIDLIDDFYRSFQPECTLDEYLLRYVADCIDKRLTA